MDCGLEATKLEKGLAGLEVIQGGDTGSSGCGEEEKQMGVKRFRRDSWQVLGIYLHMGKW